MKKRHSIRARILGGFVCMLLLQVAVAFAVWRAERQVEVASRADAAAEASASQVGDVTSLLRVTQLRLSDYLRSGSADDRDALSSALTQITAVVRRTGESGRSSASLESGLRQVSADLEHIMHAAQERRDASASITQLAIQAENAMFALAQAAMHSSERATTDSAVTVIGAAINPLAAAQRYALGEDEREADVARGAIPRLREALQDLLKEGSAPPPRVLRLATAMTTTLDGLTPAMDKLGAAIIARAASMSQLGQSVSKMSVAVQDLQSNIAAERALRHHEAGAAREAVRATVFGAAAASVLLGIGLAMLVGLSITRPVVRLATTMAGLAGGRLDLDVPGRARCDEVGAMAKAVQVFKDNGLAARALEAEARRVREAAEMDRAGAEAAREAVAAEQAQVMNLLGHSLSRLAEGDLTERLPELPEQYRQLGNDFNDAVGELQEAMSVIAGNGSEIESGAGEISQAADDLSRRTEQQAANLEQTAAALDEITATVRKTAEGAKLASSLVVATSEQAAKSSMVVQNAVASMTAIERSAAEIEQIVGIIDEIAFQTNLLALNAGVEAARAGDAGRGFAVVAGEVRALAQRSAQAAKEIKILITTSSSQVGTGTTLVAETGRALELIAAKVTEITRFISDIAASAQEQATGLQEVNTAINQMDQVTQQNAAMVEQSTAASHGLAHEAEQLASRIARFRIA